MFRRRTIIAYYTLLHLQHVLNESTMQSLQISAKNVRTNQVLLRIKRKTIVYSQKNAKVYVKTRREHAMKV